MINSKSSPLSFTKASSTQSTSSNLQQVTLKKGNCQFWTFPSLVKVIVSLFCRIRSEKETAGLGLGLNLDSLSGKCSRSRCDSESGEECVEI
jgi:hypothetical protein